MEENLLPASSVFFSFESGWVQIDPVVDAPFNSNKETTRGVKSAP